MSRSFYSTTVLLFFVFGSQVLALSAIQGSPCYDPCNGDQATSSADIVCMDDDFTNSTKGETLSQCLTCLQTSSYGSGFMTDSILFLYYLSSVQQTCLSGEPAEPISDCSNQCTDISSAFSSVGGRNFFQNPFTYCTENDNAYEDEAADCASCLQSQQGTVILGNFVYVGKIGCDTQPDVQSGASVYTSDDLFDTETLSSSSASSTSSSATSKPSSTGTATISSTTSASRTATGTSTIASSASASSPATASATAASSNSDEADAGDEDGGSGGLSRGAAAGIGIAIGIIGVAAIVFLALFARRRMAKKQEDGGPFKRMQDTPPMQQAQDWHRSATPPAAGVFVPSGFPAAPAIPVSAAAVPKKSKSFKSVASKSMKSWKNQLTPRTSEWYYAANPKHSEDLSALPQKGWD